MISSCRGLLNGLQAGTEGPVLRTHGDTEMKEQIEFREPAAVVRESALHLGHEVIQIIQLFLIHALGTEGGEFRFERDPRFQKIGARSFRSAGFHG